MDIIAKIKKGDLYALLSICTNEELEPLVKTITDTLTNNLKSDEAYKKHSPDHRKYYKNIGDEIRLFGSDSFASMVGRRGKGVEYKEVVKDVCRSLKIPFKDDNIMTNEGNLIALYELEKDKLLPSITKDLAKTFRFITSTLLTKIHPAAAIFSVIQLSAAAFRVTVPCVLHIALLRQEKINGYKKPNNSNEETNEGNKLIISTNKNNPILSFTQLSEPPSSNSEKPQQIKLKSNEISHLNSLLKETFNIATAININCTKYMKVEINGSLVNAKGGGYRAYSSGGNGKIKEQAKFFNPDKLSKLVNSSAFYNIVSTVVAQQHLADISTKLNEIKDMLESIKDFQKNERESRIKGIILYYEQIASSVINGDSSVEILSLIEQNECTLMGIQDHIKKDIDNLNSNKNLQANDTFGTEHLEILIVSYQNKIYNLYSHLLLCIRARSFGWQLLTFYPEIEERINTRKNSIRDSIKISGDNSIINRSNQSIEYNIKNLSSLFNTNHTLNDRKISLINKNKDHLNYLTKNIKSIEKELSVADRMHQNKKNNIAKMLLKIESGKVVEVSPFLS